MKKIDLTQVPKKLKKRPVLKYLPTHLKDPKCFEEIEKQLSDIMKSEHSHKSVKEFVRCKECVDRRQKRTDTMKELGFKSINQFLEWRKIMQIIKAKANFQVR